MSAQNIENFIPPIQSDGLNSAKPVNFTSTLNYLDNVVLKTASATLTTAQSGSVIVYNSTTGIVLTLPPPSVGLNYTFIVNKTPASGSHALVTDSSSTFLIGGIVSASATGSGSSAIFSGNGTSHQNLQFNGGSTGGSVGTYFTAIAVSSTLWSVNGQTPATSPNSTPFL